MPASKDRSCRQSLSTLLLLLHVLTHLCLPAHGLRLLGRRNIALAAVCVFSFSAPLPSLADSTSSSSSVVLASGESTGNERKSVRELMTEGGESFTKGDLRKSIAAFKAAEARDPALAPYLWQKGIAEYAVGDYDACAKQFASDLTVPAHAADTEESVFYLACEAKRVPETPYAKVLESLPIAPSARISDRREIMNVIYDVFINKQPETTLQPHLQSQTQSETRAKSINMNAQQKFYATFYRGLYTDAVLGEKERALELYRESLASEYAVNGGRGGGDFMITVAKVFAAGL